MSAKPGRARRSDQEALYYTADAAAKAARELNATAPHGRGPLYDLAHGELNEQDAAELRALKTQIQSRTGLRCDGYKEKCLRRRLAVRMRARGVHAFGAYAELLERDPGEYARMRDAMTINVSKFFRNPEVWSTLEQEVLPALFQLDSRELRIWSAGCAAGEEVYTLAILLTEYAERNGEDASRIRITGTDIDAGALDAARQAEYPEFAFGETPPATRLKWFDGAHHNRVRDEIRGMVRFAPLDLISGPYPPRQHLILCRNVVIYFERSIQDAVFRRFHNALESGGWLVLGKVEALFGSAAALFHTISNRERVFRKP